MTSELIYCGRQCRKSQSRSLKHEPIMRKWTCRKTQTTYLRQTTRPTLYMDHLSPKTNIDLIYGKQGCSMPGYCWEKKRFFVRQKKQVTMHRNKTQLYIWRPRLCILKFAHSSSFGRIYIQMSTLNWEPSCKNLHTFLKYQQKSPQRGILFMFTL